MHGVEELQSSKAAWVSAWVLGRSLLSLSLPMPLHAPHLRAGPSSGASRTAQPSERLRSQRWQQLPHQFSAQYLKGRRGAVGRQAAEHRTRLASAGHSSPLRRSPVSRRLHQRSPGVVDRAARRPGRRRLRAPGCAAGLKAQSRACCAQGAPNLRRPSNSRPLPPAPRCSRDAPVALRRMAPCKPSLQARCAPRE